MRVQQNAVKFDRKIQEQWRTKTRINFNSFRQRCVCVSHFHTNVLRPDLLRTFNFVAGHSIPGEMRKSHPEDESEFQLEFSDDTHKAQMLTSLNTMRKNRHFCDVILHVCALTVEHDVLRGPGQSRPFFAKFAPFLEAWYAIDRSRSKIGAVYGQLHYWVLSSRHNWI